MSTHSRELSVDPSTPNAYPQDVPTGNCQSAFATRDQSGGSDVSVARTFESLAQSPRGTYPDITLGNPAAAATPDAELPAGLEGVGGKRRRRRARKSNKKRRSAAGGKRRRSASRKTGRKARKTQRRKSRK